jgi:hypothetical protein
MKHRYSLTLLLALSTLAHRAAAQPFAEEQREHARSLLVMRIADALKLNDQEALKVGAVIRRSDEHRQQLLKQREDLETRLRAALDKTPPDPADLSQLIAAGNGIDQQLALIPEDTFRELQKSLDVEQQARLLLFRRQLQGEVRRAMQRQLGGGRRAEQRAGRQGGPPLGNE